MITASRQEEELNSLRTIGFDKVQCKVEKGVYNDGEDEPRARRKLQYRARSFCTNKFSNFSSYRFVDCNI